MKLINSILLKLTNIVVNAQENVITETKAKLDFKIPSLAFLIGYFIKFFFIVSGLIAFIYLLLGAFAWITSGGDKEAINKAQQKIQAAVIGLVMIVVVLAVVVTIETIFKDVVCLGLTCDLKFEPIIQKQQ